MRRPWGKAHRRFDYTQGVSDATCERMLQDVWALKWNQQQRLVPPASYLDHWSNLVHQTNDPTLCLHNSDVAIGLVAILRSGLDDKMSDLQLQIERYFLNTHVPQNIRPEQAVEALRFAITLRLHVYPTLAGQDLSLVTPKDIVAQSIPVKAPNNFDVGSRLTDDFCAKHLWRRGGIRIRWTDDINQHLTMIQQERSILVFRHANMLSALVQAPNLDPFPIGFVLETLDTFYLLFRPLNERKARHNIRRMEKHLDADLELAMVRSTVFDLNHYRYWYSRLQTIQAAYDRKAPASLRQWWFDRRDRAQWATFWVAFVVFVLTVVFGVIQSVTGVMQAWAAYHPAFH